MNKKYIFFLLLIPYYIHPVIIWNNIMASGLANSLDQDVQINGDTWLPAETVTIEATARDVKIYMVNGPHTVYGSLDDITTEQTTIVLSAVFPWKIEIVVSEDLTFVGPENPNEFIIQPKLIIQERGTPIDDEYPIIQWTVFEGKKLKFGPSDKSSLGGTDLQIICDISYNMPRHIFKVNGPSNDKPHIFFSRNSSWSIAQETFIGFVPYEQSVFFDVSNGQPRNHLVYFKDGSGLFFESLPLVS